MKRLLVLNFFPAFYPPGSGGEQRYYYMYLHLSKYYDITLLSPTWPDRTYEVVEFAPNYREHRIPKEAVFLKLHREMTDREVGPECSGLVCALATREEKLYHEKYRELVKHADAVIHESPYMLNYDELFRKDGKPRVYNSYNVESVMVDQIFKGPFKEKYVSAVRELERKLALECDLVLATSETEREEFHRIYGCDLNRVALAPNGFQPREEQSAPLLTLSQAEEIKSSIGLSKEKNTLLFFGSGNHPPNIEAVKFICESLAPELPDADFAVAGSVCKAFNKVPHNVKLLGFVDDTVMAALLKGCDVALNPMFSGAGTNIKMLDYMASGAAIVSTPFGARGLDVEDGVNCVISDKSAFAGTVKAILQDADKRSRIGQAARELAYSKYRWERIAEGMRERIGSLLDSWERHATGSRKRVLLLNDYPVSRPASGGEMRINSLFSSIARFHDVDLLCLSDDREVSEKNISDGFREIRVPKTVEHRKAEVEWRRRFPIPVNDILSSRMCGANDILVRKYRELLQGADIVILQHPYMAPLTTLHRPSVPVIYEAHNAEGPLKRKVFSSQPEGEELLEAVLKAEALARYAADKIICVSEEDRAEFSKSIDRSKIEVIRNGTSVKDYWKSGDLGHIKSLFRGHPVGVFIGSGHFPNIEAVRFIIEKLAQEIPEVYFLIIGSVCNSFKSEEVPENILLCGVVTKEEKNILLELSDFAVNPMFSGGGSSLKMAEYLAAGVPTVSTDFGIRGFELENRVHVIQAGIDEFAGSIREVLDDKELRESLKSAGLRYAYTNLDCDVLASRYSDIIDDLSGPSRKRLLIVTYRFNIPPLGGAEVFLNELLKGIHAIGAFMVDIVTFSISHIHNHLHFSAIYETETEEGQAAVPAYVRNIYKFEAETLPQEKAIEGCRRLFSVWQKEDLRHARLFVDRFGETTLMGGWFFPERTGQYLQRWTSDRAEIFCPSSVQALNISGRSNGRTELKISFEGELLYSAPVKGAFSIALDLSGHGPGVLSCESDARYYDRFDPRKLGVIITDISQHDGNIARRVALESDYARLMSLREPSEWIASLIAITNSREVGDDAIFFNVKGPHSEKLEDWLSSNIKKYDVLLSHGVPFSTSVIGARHAACSGVPCMVLPHYHMEDKYYHWRHFYEAFQLADRVIAAPDSAKPLFFDRIGAESVAVPGGGVSPEEFNDLKEEKAHFRSLHSSEKPFILVLGRKTGAKNYRRAIDAVNVINKRGLGCELVMIGLDEDKEPIESPFVKYYGGQPRKAVLGALASCLCLVNMSDSESFGIVIVEAWMCGRPVVANRNCQALSELVEHGHNGVLCSSDEELVAAIEDLLKNPDLSRRLGAAGHAKAVEKYTWPNISRIINEQLISLSAGKDKHENTRASSFPMISIVVPTHNRAHDLKKLLESLRKQTMEQSMFEIIVCLDDCRDDTEEIIVGFQKDMDNLRYHMHSARSKSRTRNLGLKHCRGRIIAFADDDCIPQNDWLVRAAGYFEDPRTVGIQGKITTDYCGPEWESPVCLGRVYEAKYESGCPGFMTCNMFIRRDIAERIGGFDTDFDMSHEDTDIAWRALKHGKFPFAGDVTVYHPARRIDSHHALRRKRYANEAVLFARHPRAYERYFYSAVPWDWDGSHLCIYYYLIWSMIRCRVSPPIWRILFNRKIAARWLRWLLGGVGGKLKEGLKHRAAGKTDLSGHSLAVDGELTAISNLHKGGVPHEKDFLFFKNLKSGDGIFLDVGANAGQSAVSFRAVDKRRAVVSFEPNKLYQPVLQYVKENLIDRFEYFLFGLGNEKREINLIVPYVDGKPYFQECSIDRSQFEKTWVRERLKAYGGDVLFRDMKISIEVTDDLKLSPDVVRIDAEGFELPVLEGMKKTIELHHPLFLIENNDYQRVTDFLAAYGYRAFTYDAENNRLRPPCVATNTFYLHKTHHADLIRAFYAMPEKEQEALTKEI